MYLDAQLPVTPDEPPQLDSGKWLDGTGEPNRDPPLNGIGWPAQLWTHTFGFINILTLMNQASPADSTPHMYFGVRLLWFKSQNFQYCGT